MRIPATRWLLAALLLAGLPAQAQTNDPLVGDQQYLFEVHRVDDAWTYTTGSSSTRIGLFSMLGFRQDHEDLSASRTSHYGEVLAPDLGYATEAVGVAGADTDNAVGMAGVDRAARLSSFSVLRRPRAGDDPDQLITLTRDNGQVERFFMDFDQLSNQVSLAKFAGVDVFLFDFGVPSGRTLEYPLTEYPVEGTPGNDVDFTGGLPRPQTTGARTIFAGFVEGVWDSISDCFPACFSPPDPLENFCVAVGNAVVQDGAVVVAPTGDLDAAGTSSALLYPAALDKYAVAVGGVVLNSRNDLLRWDRTKPAPYVDVAGYAEGVVSTSGAARDQYTTSFGGTAAAAGIVGGVAGLLRAEVPSLTGEDIAEVLERTAREADAPGWDHFTGHGAVDAGAALRFVRDNEITHATKRPAQILTDVSTGEVYSLRGNGYIEPVRPFCTSINEVAQGTRREFTARVEFGEEYQTVPDVWVRWAGSDGIDVDYRSEMGYAVVAYYDAFDKDLEVIAATKTGFTVRGSYWEADYFTTSGQRCLTDIATPKAPRHFDIAYTVVGEPKPVPPLQVYIDGPTTYSPSGDRWYARASGGAPSYSYAWSWREVCDGSSTHRDKCNPRWQNGGNGSSFAFGSTAYLWPVVELRVRVTDSQGTRKTDTHLAARHSSARMPGANAEALPVSLSLGEAYPNPFADAARLQFGLPDRAEATLVVYDALGRVVADLSGGTHDAGWHEATFDGAGLPSGLYLARLESGGHVVTRRLTLLR